MQRLKETFPPTLYGSIRSGSIKEKKRVMSGGSRKCSEKQQSRGFTCPGATEDSRGLEPLPTPIPLGSLGGRINQWAREVVWVFSDLARPDGDPGRSKRKPATRVRGGDARDPRVPFAEPELTDAKPYDQASGEQGLLAVRCGQHRGAGGEEGTGQQDGGSAAEDAVEGPASQRRDGGRPHRAGHQQLLPQRVQAELPLEQQHGPRHHPGVIAEQEAAQRGEDRHHVHEGGGLVLLELLPRRALQVPDAAAAARALQAAARLSGRQEAALPGRARRVRLLLLPAPLALEAAQTPQRVLHILARLAGHRAAGARGFPGRRGSAGGRSRRVGQPERARAAAAGSRSGCHGSSRRRGCSGEKVAARRAPAPGSWSLAGLNRDSLPAPAELALRSRREAGPRVTCSSGPAGQSRGDAPPLPGRGQAQPAPDHTPRLRATQTQASSFRALTSVRN